MPSAGLKAYIQHVPGQSNKSMSKPAHCLTSETVIRELSANSQDGLTTFEGKSRLEECGLNELDDGPGDQLFKILLRLVANAMMLY